ncbi:MAG TPA: TonB C-terminal domain-containing protein [Gemmatimonadaceae bacterium]|nr:TonB C-terminal domain-containing protein [Gemmatimonadaceae bacterium]
MLQRAPRSLATPIAVSAILHAVMITPFILLRGAPPRLLPPMYKVELIAAAPGPRAVGVVNDAPAPEVRANAPPKAAAPPPPKIPATRAPAKAQPIKAPVKATPNVTAKSTPKVAYAPKAAGGEQGGRGADVANVSTAGIVFPYTGYLQNIVRQIQLNFSPRGNVGALRAEVFFMIHRDGSVTGFKFLTRSGTMGFDVEAQGAVEAAAKAFGPLPAGFGDDVLPVIFSFDPSKIIR